MTNKEQIYKSYGIAYDAKSGTITSPIFGDVKPLLVNGNAKLGKGVYTWSTLPTNDVHHVNIGTKEAPNYIDVKGTCPMRCTGCYATKGCYNFNSTKKSLAIKTILIRMFPEFVTSAIIAQIKADNIKLVRWDASGDIENDMIPYIKQILKECKETKFWTYTKNKEAENAFRDFPNFNVVRSLLPCGGLNFGHCDYILTKYAELQSAGNDPYICRCGIDPNQHCNNCKGCSQFKYVLFVEHSTEYKSEVDPMFPTLKALVESQVKM